MSPGLGRRVGEVLPEPGKGMGWRCSLPKVKLNGCRKSVRIHSHDPSSANPRVDFDVDMIFINRLQRHQIRKNPQFVPSASIEFIRWEQLRLRIWPVFALRIVPK